MNEYSEIESAYQRNMFSRSGETIDIMALYKELPDKSVTGENDMSLMHLAAKYFDHEAVAYLAENGVKARADEYGSTPLHMMVRSPYTNDISRFDELDDAIYKTAAKLVEIGVNPKKKNDNGQIAYFEAGLLTMHPFIRAMADAGVKMDATGEEGKNLLHLIASRFYHRKSVRGVPEASAKTVKYLIDSGSIDPEDKDIFGKTPLNYAQSSEALELAAIISGDQSALKTGGMTLDEAVLNDNPEALKAIIEDGGDVNEFGDKGRTPLMRACEYPSPEILDYLLDKGADVNYKAGETGNTAAYFLLTSGITNIKPVKGRSPKSIVKMLRRLIDNSLDVNMTVDNAGNTLLGIVCSLAYTGGINNTLAEDLLDAGADANQSNQAGQTPLMIFAASGDEEEHGIAELLLDNGARADMIDNYSNTPLMYAASNTNRASAAKIARLILDTGNALADRANNDGRTALDIAVERDNEAVVKLILNNM